MLPGGRHGLPGVELGSWFVGLVEAESPDPCRESRREQPIAAPKGKSLVSPIGSSAMRWLLFERFVRIQAFLVADRWARLRFSCDSRQEFGKSPARFERKTKKLTRPKRSGNIRKARDVSNGDKLKRAASASSSRTPG